MFTTRIARPANRRSRTVVVLLASFLLAGAAGLAATGAGRAAERRQVTRPSAPSITLRLVEKDIATSFIDNPPRQGTNGPPSIGDQIAIRSELLTPARKHAGWLDATCTITSGGPRGGGPCHAVFSFTSGQLMGMTLLRFANDTTHVAIVGGTGVYRGATGTLDSVKRGESEFVDTLHLLMRGGAS